MQVNKIQNQSFKRLFIHPDLAEKLNDETISPKLKSDFSRIKRSAMKNGLDRKRFVDVILDENNNKIIATISSKKHGTPYNPQAIHYINPSPKGLKNFTQWVNEWNYLYNPKMIEKIKKLAEIINSPSLMSKLCPNDKSL